MVAEEQDRNQLECKPRSFLDKGNNGDPQEELMHVSPLYEDTCGNTWRSFWQA